MIKKKSGVSPVIATVLLIAMVIVLALIIFLWFKSLAQEKVLKFDQNVELICPDVAFTAEVSGGANPSLIIENTGSVSIYRLKMQKEKSRGHSTEDITPDGHGWPSMGLNPGEIYDDRGQISLSNAEKVTFIPVLVGKSDEGDKTYTCDDQWGEEITI